MVLPDSLSGLLYVLPSWSLSVHNSAQLDEMCVYIINSFFILYKYLSLFLLHENHLLKELAILYI